MNIKEKLAKEDGTHMYCYKQGAFWVCYEQSAYIVSLSKAYKPSKKWIKNIAQEVVTIGFPNTALQQWVHEQGVKPIISTEVLNVFEWGNTFVAEGYVKWKNAIVLKENKTTLHRMHIEEVRGFPLATSTPTDAFFLHSLQLKIKNKLSKIATYLQQNNVILQKTAHHMVSVTNSYLGLLSHYNTYNLRHKLLFSKPPCLLYKMGYFHSNIKKIILYKNLKQQHNKYLLR